MKNESISSQVIINAWCHYLLNIYCVHIKVLSPHCSSDGFLRDVCDGQQGGQYPFSQYGFLQIMAYWDEIEVCNPLGSRMKIHKLGNLLLITECFMLHHICSRFLFHTLQHFSCVPFIFKGHLFAVSG